MKKLMILLIVFSLIMGFPFNGSSNFLFEIEFPDALKMFTYGTLTAFQIVNWILLFATHIIIFSLIFLTNKHYYRDLLIMVPCTFILLYVAYASVVVLLLLIPFIIVWVIAIAEQNKKERLVNS